MRSVAWAYGLPYFWANKDSVVFQAARKLGPIRAYRNRYCRWMLDQRRCQPADIINEAKRRAE